MSGVNPQGVSVHSFKVPSSEELDHDYLWRFAKSLPRRGAIGIFNRSYYEEVLVVRVHPENLLRQRLPKGARGRDVWKRRYRDINDWERYLTDNGFTVVKLFLNLSREEQRIRFLRRIDLPDHNWKFSSADVSERGFWDAYQKAFNEMLTATSTDWAPWYVIPADRKWFARICAGAVVADALIGIDPRFPRVTAEKRKELGQVKTELEEQAPKGAAPDPFAAGAAQGEAAAKAGDKSKKADKTTPKKAKKAARQAAKKAKKAARKADKKDRKEHEEAEVGTRAAEEIADVNRTEVFERDGSSGATGRDRAAEET